MPETTTTRTQGSPYSHLLDEGPGTLSLEAQWARGQPESAVRGW